MHLGGGRDARGRLRLGGFLGAVNWTLCPLCHGSVVEGRRPLHTLAVHVVVHCVARGRSARPDPWLAHLPEAAVAARQRAGGELLRGESFGVDLDEDDGAVKAVALGVPGLAEADMHCSLQHEVNRCRGLESCHARRVHVGADVKHLCRELGVEHQAVAPLFLLLLLGHGRAARPLRVDLETLVVQNVHRELERIAPVTIGREDAVREPSSEGGFPGDGCLPRARPVARWHIGRHDVVGIVALPRQQGAQRVTDFA
eukprot:scaffold5830_cov66-Phaeocystis_antarctica.AAC.3